MKPFKLALMGLNFDAFVMPKENESAVEFAERYKSAVLADLETSHLPVVDVTILVESAGLTESEHMTKIDELGQYLQDFDYQTEEVGDIDSEKLLHYEGFRVNLSVIDVRTMLLELSNGIIYRLSAQVPLKLTYRDREETSNFISSAEETKPIIEDIKTKVFADLLEGFTYQDL